MQDTQSNQQPDRLDITYLTGLSFDKRLWDRTYYEAMNDRDIKDFVDAAANAESRLRTLKGIDNIRNLGGALDDLPGILRSLSSQVVTTIFGVDLMTFVNTALNARIKWLNKMYVYSDVIRQADKQAGSDDSETPRDYTKFFSLYMSNQGDVRGLYPLTRIASESNGRIGVGWGYDDKPFYDTRFIDAVYFKPRHLEIGYEGTPLATLLSVQFHAHAQEIVLGRILSDQLESVRPDVTDNVDKLRMFLDAQKERNLFGVDLLSRILVRLSEGLQSVNSDRTLKVYCASGDGNVDGRKFSSEVLRMTSDPEKVELVSEPNEADIEFFVAFEESDHPSNSPSNPSADWPNHMFYDDTFDTSTYLVRVPVKMMVSLPLDENQQASDKILIPESLRRRGDQQNITRLLLTVGGAEHNKPLAYLINKHRWQKKGERVHGFLDNRADFYRAGVVNPQNNDKGFLAGLNQPVTGYHYSRFSRRLEGTDNHSIKNDAALFYFSLTDPVDESSTIHVVSVYGFSALATAFLLELIIGRLDQIFSDGNIQLTPEQVVKEMLGISQYEPLNDWHRCDGISVNQVDDERVENRIFALERNILEQCYGMDPFFALTNKRIEPKALLELLGHHIG